MLAASGIALWQIKVGRKQVLRKETEARDIARKQATIELLARRAWDKDYLENRGKYLELREDGKGLERWVNDSKDAKANQRVINNALGDYELVAIGINSDIIDEEFYRNWYESTLIYDYQQTIGYLRALNDSRNTPHGHEGKYFIEFQALATKWINNPRS